MKLSKISFILIISLFFVISGCDSTDIELPEIEGIALVDASPYSLTVYAVLVNNGGEIPSEMGFCCGFQKEPTIDDCLVKAPVTDHALGEFQAVIGSLSPNTNYIVKAYAVNSAGVAYSSAIYVNTIP